jgi:hypothetical protein
MTSKNLPKMPNLAKNQSVSIKNIFIEETYWFLARFGRFFYIINIETKCDKLKKNKWIWFNSETEPKNQDKKSAKN